MSKKVKFDEDELRARRVFSKIEQNSKSSFVYRKKGNSKQLQKNTPRGKEVVIRITGNSKTFEKWSDHFKYNTRNNELEIYDQDSNMYEGKDEQNSFKDYYNFDLAIPRKNENKKEIREVLHLVFSMKEHEATPKEKLLKAALQTITEKYPNNQAYFVYHSDTDNPHVHCDLKIKSIDGLRIDVKKTDLENMREIFAKHLNNLGIEAYATRKWERNLSQEKILNPQKLKEVKSSMKNNHFEVIDFGKANYKFAENGKASYFVSYLSSKDHVTTIWSKELEKLVKSSDLKKGEFAKFKIISKEPFETVIKKVDKVTKKRMVYTRTSYKNIWDISIIGRAEKDLDETLKTENRKNFYSYQEKYLSDLDIKNFEYMKIKREKDNQIFSSELNSKFKKENKFNHLKKKNEISK